MTEPVTGEPVVSSGPVSPVDLDLAAVEAAVRALESEEWSANLPVYNLAETVLAAAGMPALVAEVKRLREQEPHCCPPCAVHEPGEDARALAALSRWIDKANDHRDPEAVTWGRLAKVSEECGEVIEAFIGATGQNPRKGCTHHASDVMKELLDVAFTALCAVEHLTGNGGRSMGLFSDHARGLVVRAGLDGAS